MTKAILKDLKTTELIPDEFNIRKGEWNPTDDDETKLIDSIKAQGVLEPLLVRLVKGQSTKYPKNKTYSVVCGSRRWHAAMEARQKTIPCVIRKDLNDIQSLGTSIQENLKRRSMDKTQTAEGIGRMMDMINGGRTYEQKMKEMTKLFGMNENSINMYYNIYKLSKEVTIARNSKIDTTTLSGIQQAKHWDKEEKQKAIEVLSSIDKSEDRRVALSELKHRTKETEELGVVKAHQQYEKEVDETVGESYSVYLNAKERKATKEATKKKKLEINLLIKRNHVSWLKDKGFL